MRPPAIANELRDRLPEEESHPDERTIRSWVRRWGSDQSGPWLIGDPEADPSVLVPLLADLIEQTEGNVTALTTDEARMLTRLLSALPDMPPFAAYDWTVAYLAARDHEPLDGLMHYLAFAPWRDNGSRYLKAINSGQVKEARIFDAGFWWMDQPDVFWAALRESPQTRRAK
jgi:hypothetical protein